MTKSILVVDTPDSCINCNMYGFQHCYPIQKQIPRECLREGKPEWCPLKPMPSYKAVDLNDTRDVVMFCHGWNTCLNEITGETE